jgi:hypothetical protein
MQQKIDRIYEKIVKWERRLNEYIAERDWPN